MLPSMLKLSVIVLICHVQFSSNIILSGIYQQYLRQQGLEFRENAFLGNKPILSEYDFVIIGGGVAGSVLANRLSENPRWKILLLEAGEDENIYTDIPLLAHFNSLTHFNWGYKLEKEDAQPQCLAMYNAQCPCPRGKGLGGSSILNYMIYTRGNKKDYDNFEAAGNKGWGYESVLKYFLKSENNTSEFLDADIHGNSGPLKITNIPYQNLLTEKFTQATCELGYPLYDYTGKEPATEGFSKLQATISKGQRFSASRAYLKSIKKRTSQNLHISIFSHVTRILIDPKTKRAHGVEFQKEGVKRIVLAKKEVLLSAGAIGSPQILMLSGIGPEEHLKEFNIDVVSNLKGVGQSMRDHHSFFGLTFLVNRTNTGSTIEKQVVTIDQFLKWLKLGRGPLSVPGGVTGIGYLNTKYNSDKTYPDTEYLFTIGSFNSDSGRIFRKSMNVRKDIYDSVFGNINNREVWSIIPVVLRPKTRGYVKLKSKNPFKYPKIFYDFFQHEEDSEVMLEAIKNIIKISETEAFQSIGSRIHKTPIPECAHHEFGCDDYWRCAMRYFTSSLYHQSGTCRMGPQSDSEAVVDDQLKVYGVTNLRVVDASIFPEVPSAHLYAPTVMVGEKASDMIKEEWKNVDDNKPSKNSGCYSNPNTQAGFESNKPSKTPCSANHADKVKPSESHSKPDQLDNQKHKSTTTTSTTTTENYYSSVDKGPVTPNQPDFVQGWQNYVNQTWGNIPSTEAPGKETTPYTTENIPSSSVSYGNPSQTNSRNPGSQSSTYPPYIPNGQPSTAYPPFIPNQQPSTTYTPYIPNQQSSTLSPYIPNQNPSSTVYPPYIVNQQPSTTYPPYIPNQQPSSTIYPPYVPNQQPNNGYPTQLNNIPSASGSFSNSQYPEYQQQVPGYPPLPGFQQQPVSNNYNQNQGPPPNQFNGYSNQSAGYPSQAYVPQSGTFTYPTDQYQIHTIYPGSSSQNNIYPQPSNPPSYPQPINQQPISQSNNYQSYPNNPLPALQQQYYQPGQNNLFEQTNEIKPPSNPQNPYTTNQHVQPNHPAAATNEIGPSNQDLQFPNKQQQGAQGTHPAHQNGPQISPQEDINYAGVTSLHNIPYYNVKYLNQLQFDPNSRNGTPIPAALFVNNNLMYQSPYRIFNKRNSKHWNLEKTKALANKDNEVEEATSVANKDNKLEGDTSVKEVKETNEKANILEENKSSVNFKNGESPKDKDFVENILIPKETESFKTVHQNEKETGNIENVQSQKDIESVETIHKQKDTEKSVEEDINQKEIQKALSQKEIENHQETDILENIEKTDKIENIERAQQNEKETDKNGSLEEVQSQKDAKISDEKVSQKEIGSSDPVQDANETEKLVKIESSKEVS